MLFFGIQGVALHRHQLGDGGVPGLLLQVEQRVLGRFVVAALPVGVLRALIAVVVVVVLRHRHHLALLIGSNAPVRPG